MSARIEAVCFRVAAEPGARFEPRRLKAPTPHPSTRSPHMHLSISGRRAAAHAMTVLALAFSATLAAPALAAEPGALFAPIESVLMHPRCLNCHTVTSFPRQSDQRLRHNQQVARGAEGKGVPALKCVSCHQATNQGRVPGAPNWHLAPLSMGWEGLTPAGLCAALKDPKKNGGRKTADQVIEHMKTDPLVLWAWQPGAERATPPLGHAEFVTALAAWGEQGMLCPR
jgi:hypothetical protein